MESVLFKNSRNNIQHGHWSLTCRSDGYWKWETGTRNRVTQVAWVWCDMLVQYWPKYWGNPCRFLEDPFSRTEGKIMANVILNMTDKSRKLFLLRRWNISLHILVGRRSKMPAFVDVKGSIKLLFDVEFYEIKCSISSVQHNYVDKNNCFLWKHNN